MRNSAIVGSGTRWKLLVFAPDAARGLDPALKRRKAYSEVSIVISNT
jgi:hypothetical protein